MNCTKCLEEKDDSERSYKSKNQCKSCVNKYMADYYRNNENVRKRMSESYKRSRRKLRIQVLSHYSKGTPKCNCCGETMYEFLSIDHINNDGAKHRKEKITSKMLYQWLVKNNYPENFQVLCMNCNFAKGHYGFCPHNKKTTSEEAVL